MAGELATEYGLTGCPTGDASKAAGECFQLWLNECGHGVLWEAHEVIGAELDGRRPQDTLLFVLWKPDV